MPKKKRVRLTRPKGYRKGKKRSTTKRVIIPVQSQATSNEDQIHSSFIDLGNVQGDEIVAIQVQAPVECIQSPDEQVILSNGVKVGKICCLCFNESGTEFEVIDEVTKEIFDALLLEPNLNVSENLVMCNNCAESARKCFEFKFMLLSTEKSILSFAIAKQEVSFVINDIFEGGKGVKTLDEDLGICRFCMSQSDRSNLVSMENITDEVMLVDSLAIFVPEMDFDIIKGAMLCSVCKMSLEFYIVFLNKFLDAEEEINNISQNKQIDDMGKPRTSDTQQSFSFRHAKVNDVKRRLDKLKETLKIKGIDVEEEELGCGTNTYENPSKVTPNEDDNNSPNKKTMNNPIKKFNCTLCGFETKYKQCLDIHMKRHRGRGEIQWDECIICGYENKCKSMLKRHIMQHKDRTKLNWHKCTLCGYEAKYKPYLKRHTMRHEDGTKIKYHKCILCGYETRYKSYLKKHVMKHRDRTKEDWHKCTLCEYETKYIQYLKSHTMRHKNRPEVIWHKCPLCVYETNCKEKLQNHMMSCVQVCVVCV